VISHYLYWGKEERMKHKEQLAIAHLYCDKEAPKNDEKKQGVEMIEKRSICTCNYDPLQLCAKDISSMLRKPDICSLIPPDYDPLQKPEPELSPERVRELAREWIKLHGEKYGWLFVTILACFIYFLISNISLIEIIVNFPLNMFGTDIAPV
jgi:hypothetical protein